MEPRKEIEQKLSKIRSIVFNMAQERRIKSDELDDFNQAFRKLIELFDSVFLSVELMEKEAVEIQQLKVNHSNRINKLELCAELLGATKKGIDHLSNYPTEFIETALSIRMKDGTPIETEIDFWWIDQLWNGITIHIENDVDSFKQANFFKKIYHETSNPEQRKIILKTMNDYASELAYMSDMLGKEIDETELKNTIAAYWYEFYRDNTTAKI